MTKALDFSEWLTKTGAEAQVDASQADHLHTAMLQCLRYYRPRITAPAADALINNLMAAEA